MTSFTNTSKIATSWGNQSKSSTTFTNQPRADLAGGAGSIFFGWMFLFTLPGLSTKTEWINQNKN